MSGLVIGYSVRLLTKTGVIGSNHEPAHCFMQILITATPEFFSLSLLKTCSRWMPEIYSNCPIYVHIYIHICIVFIYKVERYFEICTTIDRSSTKSCWVYYEGKRKFVDYFSVKFDSISQSEVTVVETSQSYVIVVCPRCPYLDLSLSTNFAYMSKYFPISRGIVDINWKRKLSLELVKNVVVSWLITSQF